MSSLLEPDLQHKIDHPKITRDDPSFAAGKMAAFQYFSVGVFLFLVATVSLTLVVGANVSGRRDCLRFSTKQVLRAHIFLKSLM